MNVFKSGEPENLVGRFENCGPKVGKPTLGVRHDQYPKLRLAEEF
jgi:hypothetical protein